MTFSPKTSFLFRFIFYFSITLIVLGIIQAFFGTFRLYNHSEQEYEKLSPEKTFGEIGENIEISNTTTLIPFVTFGEAITTDSPYFAAENDPPKTEAKQEPKKKILAEKKKIVEPKKIDTVLSPVTIIIEPKNSVAPKYYLEATKTVIMGRYFNEALWKFPIIIDTKRVEPRGQMYNESITLGSGMSTLSEIAKVLTHEIAHMIDIYTFKKNLKKSDLSEEFYAISWKDATTIKAGVLQKSFISGYAATNQYEDFAESFTMYIFHNREFLKRTQDNEGLKLKYIFLKTRVFGNTFTGSSYEQGTVPQKIWDVTKIAIRGNNIDTVFAWLNFNFTYKS